MNITIENIPCCRIAYLRQTGPYGQNNVQVMEELKEWARSESLLDEQAVILGIAHDNPELAEPMNCRYDTCLVLSKDYQLDNASVKEGSIPGGIYAIFKIKHTAEAVQKAWIEIFPELLGQNYQPDSSRPILERYKAELVKEHSCEICVPICVPICQP